MLSFENVTAGYGDTAIVRDVSLVVPPGEIVGLVGPNGAGKSTLLRAITGSADVNRGALTLNGTSLANMNARDRARSVGVVPQSVEATFSFSAREFVLMGRHVRMTRFGTASAHDHDVVQEMLELTDTAYLADDPVDTLSGGDLQRLALAQALAQEPDVLLLDEATSHLDLNHRLQVLNLVRRLADEGKAVLAVFHDLDLAARYTDRLAVVHEGGIFSAGGPSDVLTPEMLRSVFGVRAVVGADPVTGSLSVTPVLREQDVPPESQGSVFIAAGGGAGSHLMGLLALEGFSVSAGVLNHGDMDREVAASLMVTRVDLTAYDTPPEEIRTQVLDMARKADARVVFAVPYGPANLANLEAAAAAEGPLVLVGTWSEELDFTHGEATKLWRSLQADSIQVTDARRALAAVRGLVHSEP